MQKALSLQVEGECRSVVRGLRSPLDSVLTVYTLAGNGIGGNDDSGGPDSYLRFQAPADDTYVVSVKDHLGKGGPNYAYRVEVAPVKPTLTDVAQFDSRRGGSVLA